MSHHRLYRQRKVDRKINDGILGVQLIEFDFLSYQFRLTLKNNTELLDANISKKMKERSWT